MGFSLPRTITRLAVRSYRTFSPLPRPTLARQGGIFSVALSVTRALSAHPRPLAGMLPWEDRTFLSPFAWPAAARLRRQHPLSQFFPLFPVTLSKSGSNNFRPCATVETKDSHRSVSLFAVISSPAHTRHSGRHTPGHGAGPKPTRRSPQARPGKTRQRTPDPRPRRHHRILRLEKLVLSAGCLGRHLDRPTGVSTGPDRRRNRPHRPRSARAVCTDHPQPTHRYCSDRHAPRSTPGFLSPVGNRIAR